MEVFAELVQELVVDSLDFHTFKDVSAAQALRQSGAARYTNWPVEGLMAAFSTSQDARHGTQSL